MHRTNIPAWKGTIVIIVAALVYSLAKNIAINFPMAQILIVFGR